MTNCLNLVPFNKPVCLPENVNAYSILYFYFAVGLNLLWIIVPLWEIVTNVLESGARKRQVHLKNKKIN